MTRNSTRPAEEGNRYGNVVQAGVKEAMVGEAGFIGDRIVQEYDGGYHGALLNVMARILGIYLNS